MGIKNGGRTWEVEGMRLMLKNPIYIFLLGGLVACLASFSERTIGFFFMNICRVRGEPIVYQRAFAKRMRAGGYDPHARPYSNLLG